MPVIGRVKGSRGVRLAAHGKSIPQGDTRGSSVRDFLFRQGNMARSWRPGESWETLVKLGEDALRIRLTIHVSTTNICLSDVLGYNQGGRTSENLGSIPVSHGSVDVVCNQQVPGIEADKGAQSQAIDLSQVYQLLLQVKTTMDLHISQTDTQMKQLKTSFDTHKQKM